MVSTMPPGVKEASISWVPQLIRGKAVFLADACLQKLVASFLATNFLNWLEVCSIIGMVPHAFHELRRLEDLLSSVCSPSPCTAHVLTIFVGRFGRPDFDILCNQRRPSHRLQQRGDGQLPAPNVRLGA